MSREIHKIEHNLLVIFDPENKGDQSDQLEIWLDETPLEAWLIYARKHYAHWFNEEIAKRIRLKVNC